MWQHIIPSLNLTEQTFQTLREAKNNLHYNGFKLIDIKDEVFIYLECFCDMPERIHLIMKGE